MPRHRRRDPMFRYRRHEHEIIVHAVRWYISYRLSLRDLAELLDERAIKLHPSTISRWVQCYASEFEQRWDRLRRRTGSSWRVYETYAQIRGQWLYLYPAAGNEGRTIDFLPRPGRDAAAGSIECG